jgi:hypothetical protein
MPVGVGMVVGMSIAAAVAAMPGTTGREDGMAITMDGMTITSTSLTATITSTTASLESVVGGPAIIATGLCHVALTLRLHCLEAPA